MVFTSSNTIGPVTESAHTHAKKKEEEEAQNVLILFSVSGDLAELKEHHDLSIIESRCNHVLMHLYHHDLVDQIEKEAWGFNLIRLGMRTEPKKKSPQSRKCNTVHYEEKRSK